MPMSSAGAMPVATLAADLVARVAEDADLWDVARTMVDADVGALAVGSSDEVRGIVSERDVVRALAAGRDPATTTAIDIGRTDLVSCDATATVAEVSQQMMESYVRHVLLTDGGRVVGIVSARDLLGAYAAAEGAGA